MTPTEYKKIIIKGIDKKFEKMYNQYKESEEQSMNCMWNNVYGDIHEYDDCTQCPIKKYNCCAPSVADEEELAYQLELEIQRFTALRKKLLDKMGQ